MSKAKMRPNQLLWIAFAVQATVSLVLLLGAIYFQIRHNRLTDQQPKIQASAERARARIQSEGDIEKLRAAALHIQNASDFTWDTVIRVTGDLSAVLWSFFFGSFIVTIISGYTVYAFLMEKSPPNKALEPTAGRSDAHI